MSRRPKEDPPSGCVWVKDRTDDDWVVKVSKPSDPWLVSEQTTGPMIIEVLENMRRVAIRDNEESILLQKASAKEKNYDAARWHSDLASASLKTLRAVRLWLGHFGSDLKDCPWVEFFYWPTGLAPEIHAVASALAVHSAFSDQGDAT